MLLDISTQKLYKHQKVFFLTFNFNRIKRLKCRLLVDLCDLSKNTLNIIS